MNYKMIFYILGYVLGFEALFMLIPLGISVYHGENSCVFSFIMAIAIAAVLAFLLIRRQPRKKAIYATEGFIIVALAWIFLSIIGSLPFFFSGSVPSFLDALFESVSGFTTTGFSVITDVEALPLSILFWRSFSQWIGGMGVLVFIMAIISLAGGNTIHLMRAESPGPSPGKLVPKIGQTAKILYGIYMMMTGAEILLLYLGGMPIFDSIVNSFATAGTGGFTLINDSIAFYDSAYLQGVINVFMVLFGVSFNFYFLIMIKKVTQALHYEEVWAYLVIIGSAIILVACNLFGPIYQTLGEALRYASFHVVSLMTTTGFITADYTQWPQFSQFVLFFLTFVGGCAVSTGGGIKVARILLLFKAARMEIDKLIHPRAVQSLHLNGKPVEPFIMKGIRAYMVAYAAIFIASTLIISWEGFDFVTTLTVVSGSINNIGTGLGAIGPGSSLAIFNPVSKIVSIFDMLAGRLEIFPIWVMLMPGIWKATRNNKI